MKDMTENGIEEKDSKDRQRWKQTLQDVFSLKENLSIDVTPIEEEEIFLPLTVI